MHEAGTLSEITTRDRHSKVDAKTLAQIWRIGLGPTQQTLKTTTQVGIRHAVNLLTHRYKTYIIHGYNARRLNMKIYFDTLFPKFRSLNKNTCAQLFTNTEFIILHPSKSNAGAGNCLREIIDDIGITINMRFDNAVDFLREGTELMNSIKKHYINWNVTKPYIQYHNRVEDGIKRIKLKRKSTMQRTGYSPRQWDYGMKHDA